MITKKKKKWLQKTEWSLIKLFQKLHLLPTKKRKKNIFFLQFRKQYFKKFKFFQIISILPKYINIFNWNLFFLLDFFHPFTPPTSHLQLLSLLLGRSFACFMPLSSFLPSSFPSFLPSFLPLFLHSSKLPLFILIHCLHAKNDFNLFVQMTK